MALLGTELTFVVDVVGVDEAADEVVFPAVVVQTDMSLGPLVVSNR